MKPKPVCLIVLDGWGHREHTEHNAIAQAHTPFFDSLIKEYPHTLLDASEEAVGLPKGTIGNSEIGHMTMGAGTTIDTELVRISKAIQNDELKNNPAISKLFEHVKKYDSALHILGLVSPAGVHSHQDHLHGLLAACKNTGLAKVIIHAFTDGRDSPPKDNFKYLEELEKVLSDLRIGRIATATGRYFAMDRDKNWHRTEKAEKALFEAHGKILRNQKPSEVLKTLYDEGVMDEYLEPIVFLDKNGKSYPISKNDGVFFFNFRTDRPRQLAFKIMERAKKQNLFFATMTEYHPDLGAVVAFPPLKLDTTLAAEISRAGLKQSHIAETEKYGHVTFFFNGGRQTPHEREEHFLIESRKDIPTHDFAPEMRAKEIADTTIERINAGDDFLLLNFANADMVGHTANKPAIITAVETVDRELKRVCGAVMAKDGILIVTADHGNAEVNIDSSTGEKHTAHTTSLVPFILVSNLQTTRSTSSGQASYKLQANGTLADIAPTILELIQIKKPVSMTGKSLIIKSP
ncbi:MAG: 2,3-bisphosphoglycerate-independent phosphoglycerate mutase [Candidatus Doudnabacteria bacterium]|nr:2,3-bisphosphoglycerate-independent phosphoglycerate mutase [Candidatus Doudnabacteria bacterium]